jgi:DUF177 domain-containing protein
MSLQFNVSQLLKSEVGQARLYTFEADEPIDLDGSLATNVAGRVRFMLTNFGIVATAEATGTLRLNCARCLEDFDKPVEISFTEEYRPTVDIGTGLPARESHSETAFDISENHTIDLTEALRQHFLLAVDLIPVCRDDCRGLCATCGVNLNTETCTCPPTDEPHPFAVLQGLLGDTRSD